MDPATKESAYGTLSYDAAGTAIMDFTPINSIHQHLCAFHTYALDQTRQVEAHHFCTHLNADFHQCVVYDSDKPDARLIGIEYLVSEKVFLTLPEDERKYWHSHKYEVESGILQLHTKNMVPGGVTDLAEQPAMIALQQTYGKTIHTWQIDKNPDLPLGPPMLMMAYTADGQADEELLRSRDLKMGDSSHKKENRHLYLPKYEKAKGSDEWEETGEAVSFEPVMKSIKFSGQ